MYIISISPGYLIYSEETVIFPVQIQLDQSRHSI